MLIAFNKLADYQYWRCSCNHVSVTKEPIKHCQKCGASFYMQEANKNDSKNLSKMFSQKYWKNQALRAIAKKNKGCRQPLY